MSKIIIDCDKIDNLLTPITKNQLSQLRSAATAASRVNFPNDEFNWGKIVTDINDSIDDIKSYYEWIADVVEKMKTNITNFEEELDNISITEIANRESFL